MNRSLTYKNHIIVLDGIAGIIYTDDINSDYIYKMKYIGYSQASIIMQLKSFINLRLRQLEIRKAFSTK